MRGVKSSRALSGRQVYETLIANDHIEARIAQVFFDDGSGHLVVPRAAGCAKTSTARRKLGDHVHELRATLTHGLSGPSSGCDSHA